MMHDLRQIPRLVMTLLAAAILASCVTDNGGTRPQPDRPPQGIKPAMLSLLVTADFRDTDGNELRDTALAYVYLFGDDPRYASSISAQGEFTFVMFATTGERLAEWRFSPEQTAKAVADSPLGPRFEFLLDLRAIGRENLPVRQASLGCTFKPADGNPIAARDTIPVTVGRTR